MNTDEAKEISYRICNREYFRRLPKIDAMIRKAANEGKYSIVINISLDGNEGNFLKREYTERGYNFSALQPPQGKFKYGDEVVHTDTSVYGIKYTVIGLVFDLKTNDLLYKVTSKEEKSSPNTQYALYSATADKENGHSIYLTPDNRQVKVTSVGVDVVKLSRWDTYEDSVFVGEVKQFIWRRSPLKYI